MSRKRAQAVEPPSKRPLHLSIDADTLGRLTAYAGFRRESVSAVVTRAVDALMRSDGFVVYTREGGQGVSAPPALPSAEGGRQDGPGTAQDRPRLHAV
jgi:hypothetical protein